MYMPKHFEKTDVAAMHRLIGDHPFATVVVATANGSDANHFPLIIESEPAPFGTLRGHIARANPLSRETLTHPDALVIFQGPDGFVSPSWYPSKAESGKVVPTWNYAIVHARGPIRFVDDAAWLRANVEALTSRHEGRRPAPWKVSDAPADYIDKMISSIVGVEIPIVSLVGKWKLSQNRPAADRQGVIDGLRSEGSESARTMADWVNAAQP